MRARVREFVRILMLVRLRVCVIRVCVCMYVCMYAARVHFPRVFALVSLCKCDVCVCVCTCVCVYIFVCAWTVHVSIGFLFVCGSYVNVTLCVREPAYTHFSISVRVCMRVCLCMCVCLCL
jgi:hypothetical protein